MITCLFSSTIDRNKRNIPGDVLAAIITGSQEFFDELRTFGVAIQYLGGENRRCRRHSPHDRCQRHHDRALAKEQTGDER